MISVEGIPDAFTNHLVNQNGQISRLEINDIRLINLNGHHSVFTAKLANLSQLGLFWVNSVELFEAFERWPATLNLQKFNLQFAPELFPFVPWSHLLNVMGSKINSDTCTELLLDMPEPVPNSIVDKNLLSGYFMCKTNMLKKLILRVN